MKSNYAKLLAGLAICICLQSVTAMSLSGLKNQAFMILGSQKSSENVLRRQTRAVTSSITSMRVTSVVKSRFAKVTTVSEMENTDDEAKELTFSIRLPDAAFITEFNMLVDGVTFIGKVKEKALAEEEYKKAAQSGHSAGLVTAKVRETQTFSVAANVPAQSSVTFTLVYQELLKRKLSKYNHEIFVNPGQVVDDFVIDVYITERTGITMLEGKPPHSQSEKTKDLKSGYNEEGIVPIDIHIRRSKYQAKITYKPSPAQQRRLLMIPENDRKMTTIYDVTRETLGGGDIQIRNGYFVHYFAPENLPVLPKKVVFVIDRSGSMSGEKMKQTKIAFEAVLKEMSEGDEFNIVTFSSDVTVWKKGLIQVTEENVNSAIEYVRGIHAGGGTDLNRGILRGAKFLRHVKPGDKVSSAVITLTDGDPTSGITDEAAIRRNVKQAVNGRFSVFCLGFGKYLNHDFLKRMANENNGITRKIYEDADAAMQLEGFFKEVATPLLLHLEMRYSGSAVADVSQMNYEKYFKGSEVIVVGAKLEEDVPLESTIVATSLDGDVEFNIVGNEVDESYQHWYEDTGDFDDFIERIWAYYTIKEKLKKKVLAETDAEVKQIVDEVMRLSLKYNFVTPLTSMVVVLPEDEITTTASTSTEFPPPPRPCWLRGEKLPEYVVEPPIMCPYIIDEKAEAKVPSSPSRPSSLSRSGSFSRLAAPALMVPPPPQMNFLSYRGGAAANVAAPGPPAAIAPQMQAMYYPSYGFSSAAAYDYDECIGCYNGRDVIEKADNCSGVLSGDSGSVFMPGLNHSLKTVYCEWDIQLPEGSWIDLKVERLDTSENDIYVESDNQELFSYTSGVKAAKYYYIANNEIHIRMTVYPGETKEQGLVLTYKKFTPGEIATESQPGAEISDTNDLVICGHTITPLEGDFGYITSPNYPLAYPSNAHCSWHLENFASATMDLQIFFVDLDIEMNGEGQCAHDKVVITMDDHSVEYCGSQSHQTFTASGDIVTVDFFSDGDLETSGFKVLYEFVPKTTK